MDTKLRNFKEQPVFITSDNYDNFLEDGREIEKIIFDQKMLTLVQEIERVKPEIFEEQLEKNIKQEIIDKILIERLYTKEEATKRGKNNIKASQYSSKEIKEIAKGLGIVIGKKSRDELIEEVKNIVNSSN